MRTPDEAKASEGGNPTGLLTKSPVENTKAATDVTSGICSREEFTTDAVNISPDFPRLTAKLYEQINGCRHERTEVRAMVIADGRVQHVAQCKKCHRKVGGAVKQVGDVPAFDLANFNRINAQLEEYRQRTWKESEAQRALATAAWRDEYTAYLNAYEWRVRRDRILRRSKGVCEGCNTNPATEVHHLTYRHLFNEFDNELVAYCRECHERIHEKGNFNAS